MHDLRGQLKGQPSRLAERLELRTGIAIPGVCEEEVLAVLTFYAYDLRHSGDRMLRTLTGLGDWLARFLDRRRASLAAPPLSARKLEVLRLAADGLSGPAIARRLVVQPATVKSHLEQIYRRLGVTDRAAAVAVAVRTGLIR